MVLIVIAAALALFCSVFIYIYYFAPAESAPQNQVTAAGDSRAASEQAIKRIERDISAIENEMQNDFYKSLRKHIWTPDTTAPGNEKPFSQLH